MEFTYLLTRLFLNFSDNAEIIENYPCLQLYTTRNMRSGIFIDWLWGGLNYQIEHHLFPTMPRNNLSKVNVVWWEFWKWIESFLGSSGTQFLV